MRIRGRIIALLPNAFGLKTADRALVESHRLLFAWSAKHPLKNYDSYGRF